MTAATADSPGWPDDVIRGQTRLEDYIAGLAGSPV
jgi:hypothetical protein